MPNTDKKKPAPQKSAEHKTSDKDGFDIQDMEDRLFLIWKENKLLIMGGIAFIFVAFLAVQGFKYWQVQSEKNVQNSYLAAASDEEKAAWAKDEAGHPLSGFAFKELGDKAFQAGDLAAAEERYRNAVEHSEGVVKEAATIALAVTLIEANKAAEGKEILERVANDPESAAQPEARYRLAVLASKENDAATARSHIEAIDPSARFWKAQANQLAEELSES